MYKTTHLCLLALIIASNLMGILEVLYNLQEKEIPTSTANIWNFVFLIGTIFWAYHDANREDFEKPFDFGFLVYVFWPIAFPWYLIQTRGFEGVLVYLGFIFLWLWPWCAGLVAYVYYS